MTYTKLQRWERFPKYRTEFPQVGRAIDLSRMDVSDEFLPDGIADAKGVRR